MTLPEFDHRRIAAEHGVDPSEVGCLTYLIGVPVGFVLAILSFLLAIVVIPFALVGALLAGLFGESDR